MSKLPESFNYGAILTVVDRLTKYIQLILCWMGQEKLSAPTVAKLFV